MLLLLTSGIANLRVAAVLGWGAAVLLGIMMSPVGAGAARRVLAMGRVFHVRLCRRWTGHMPRRGGSGRDT